MLAHPILPQVEEFVSTLKDLMPTIYQKETLESIFYPKDEKEENPFYKS